jgi:hypothetical protein
MRRSQYASKVHLKLAKELVLACAQPALPGLVVLLVLLLSQLGYAA